MTTTALAAEASSTELLSLFWVVLVICVAPILSGLTRTLVPAVVLLLAGGMLIGPYGLGLAEETGGIAMLSEIGLGMLFLLAGFELKVSTMTGRRGAGAIGIWVSGAVLATGVGWLVTGRWETSVAIGLLLTSTAVGTLLPILKDSGHHSTPVGQAVLSHGAIGELGPVLAMALLLGTRNIGASAAAVGLFLLAALLLLVVPERLLYFPGAARTLSAGNTSTGQLVIRMVLLLLASMMAVATVFGLDVVLGAFAAGMILRRLVEEFALRRAETPGEAARDLPEELQRRLDTVGYSIFIPVFFVVSGMGISVEAVAGAPMLLVVAVASMLFIRGGGVWLGERLFHVSPGLTTTSDRARVGLYSATGLPIIVAVTEVAVNIDLMKAGEAAVLVAAGAVTVLLFPLLAEMVGTPLPSGRRRAAGRTASGANEAESAPSRVPGDNARDGSRGDKDDDKNDDDDDSVDTHNEERIR